MPALYKKFVDLLSPFKFRVGGDEIGNYDGGQFNLSRPIAMGTQRIMNVGTPTALSDAGLYSQAVVKGAVNMNVAAIKAAGAVTTFQYTLVTLPNPGKLLRIEVLVNTILAGTGLSTSLLTLEGGSDAVGSLVGSVSTQTTGYKAGGASNPYISRDGQALKMSLTITGGTLKLSGLTAGDITVNYWYTQGA